MGCSGCNMGIKHDKISSTNSCSLGCSRLSTFDWLMDMPEVTSDMNCKIIEVSFNNGSRKDFFYNNNKVQVEKGNWIVLEGVNGFDIGTVSLTGELVRLQMKKTGVKEVVTDLKKVLRLASERDLIAMQANKIKEEKILTKSRDIAKSLNLAMKISETEVQADGRKVTFFYIANGRVDFRELIKMFASEFKMRVEMRQIGARQESAKVGGIGSCGRELCCSTWLNDFKSVSTVMARYQNLSINQTKLSGQCGRLKCCLNYELDTYLDALQHFPNNCDTLEVTKGRANLVKKDIFKDILWYVFSDSNKQYPVSIETAKKLRQLNIKGVIPEELEVAEVIVKKEVTEIQESSFVDVVGQITLKNLDNRERRKKQKQFASNKSPTQQQKPTTNEPGNNNQTKPNERRFFGKRKKKN